MTRFHFILLWLFCSYSLFSQGIVGTIYDESNQPIPYATVYIENLQTGTTANEKGFFKFKLEPGNHKITFRAMGYYPSYKEIAITNKFENIDIRLKTQVYQLNEVVLSKSKEDPAYAIMRKVISLAPFHLNEVKHYNSDVYLRGTIVIIKIPKLMGNMFKINDKSLKSGDVFVEESYNEIAFDAPKKYNQKVKSIKSSFPPSQKGKVNPIGLVQGSFYDQSDDYMISPLSTKAFFHYNFVYEGFSMEGNNIIDKIKVIPRRKSPQLYSGYMYIVEDQWCIHSYELTDEQSFGTEKIRQVFANVKGNVWLPVSHNFFAKGGFMGAKGEFNYTASIKYTDIAINEKNIKNKVQVAEKKPEEKTAIKETEKKKSKDLEEIEKLSAKDNLTTREMIKLSKALEKEYKKETADDPDSLEIKSNRSFTFEKDAFNKDSDYWQTVRAVPLSATEISSVLHIDSAQYALKTRTKADSVPKQNVQKHKTNLGKLIIGGESWLFADSAITLKYNGLITPSSFGFNAVDGYFVYQSFELTYDIDSVRNIKVLPKVGYAFNREALQWKIRSEYNYSPMHRGQLSVEGGIHSSDFNSASGIKPIVNTFAALCFKENYIKLYENRYINLSNQIDIANGLKFVTTANYSHNISLVNSTDFSFIDRKELYKPNIPDNSYYVIYANNIHKSFWYNVNIDYTPRQHYRITDGQKRMMYSNYPSIGINYKQAFSGVMGSTSSFQQVEIGLYQWKNLGFFNNFQYNIRAGKFFNTKNLHFSEFNHFNTQNIPVNLNDFYGFRDTYTLLDYYKYSTNDYYLKGSISYQTPLLLIKYIPGISKLGWNENIYLNYLTTPALKNYTEVGYSLSEIYYMGTAGIYASFTDGKYNGFGIRVSILFFAK
jgi:hypothetical protein